MKKWIIALLTICAAFFFLRSYWHEPSGDEIVYQYVWEEDDPTNLWTEGHRFERKISSFADILQTQRIHYMKWSGRNLVHAIEQSFTGHFTAFYILNTFVFLSFVWLIVIFVSRGSATQSSYLLWLSVILSLLYLFPYQQSLWTSINYGPNYLWPCVLSMLVLLLWQRISDGRVPPRWNWAVALAAFVAGWSNEAFAVGLAGGTFIYYWLNFRRLPRQIIWLVIPLWIGTAILVLAQGNLIRFFGQNGEDVLQLHVRIFIGANNIMGLWLIRLTVILVAVELYCHRRRITTFLRSSSLLLCVFCVTFLFTIVANSRDHSHTLMVLVCLLLVLRYLSDCRYFDKHTNYQRALCVVITLLFATHQAILCMDSLKERDFQRRMVAEYIDSPDGLVRYDAPKLFPYSCNYIRRLTDINTYLKVMYIVYGKSEKPLTFLRPEEYDAVTGKTKLFVPENRLPGTAAAYSRPGFQYVWIHPDSVCTDCGYEYELAPISWSSDVHWWYKVKYLLLSEPDPLKQHEDVDSVNTRYGTMYNISSALPRIAKSVNAVKLSD